MLEQLATAERDRLLAWGSVCELSRIGKVSLPKRLAFALLQG